MTDVDVFREIVVHVVFSNVSSSNVVYQRRVLGA